MICFPPLLISQNTIVVLQRFYRIFLKNLNVAKNISQFMLIVQLATAQFQYLEKFSRISPYILNLQFKESKF